MVEIDDTEEVKSGLNRFLNAIAYPFSAVVGAWFADTKLGNETYNSVQFHDGLKDLRDPVIEKAKEVGRDAVKRAAEGKPVDLYKETRPIHNKFAVDVEKRFEQLNLGSRAKKWNFIQRHQKQAVFLHGIKAAAITLGVTLTIANMQEILDQLRKKNNDNEESKSR